jgi:hypothetical protein
MKKYLLLTASVLLSAEGFGAEIGVSGAVGYSNEIRLPIKTQAFIYEPYLSYNISKSQQEFEGGMDSQQSGLGLGVWKVIDMSEAVYAQFGGQLGYIKANTKYSYESINSLYGRKYSEQEDGYLLAPGVGLFYKFNAEFEAGLEIKYRYQHLKGHRETTEANYPDYVWNKQPTANVSSTDASVQTQAVVRIYF